jgi:hypothetical protein
MNNAAENGITFASSGLFPSVSTSSIPPRPGAPEPTLPASHEMGADMTITTVDSDGFGSMKSDRSVEEILMERRHHEHDQPTPKPRTERWRNRMAWYWKLLLWSLLQRRHLRERNFTPPEHHLYLLSQCQQGRRIGKSRQQLAAPCSRWSRTGSHNSVHFPALHQANPHPHDLPYQNFEGRTNLLYLSLMWTDRTLVAPLTIQPEQKQRELGILVVTD